jgi:hypothetical protein
MDLTRRFVFRGNASALGGQLFRPKTVIIDLDGASSLGVSGGRSQSQIAGRAFGDIITFGSAFTLAEGLFDEEKQASLVTDHKGTQDQLTTTTTVTGEIRELSVGRKPVFSAKRVRATLVSRSPNGSGEPSIAPARDTTIQGVDIGGRGLNVTLNLGVWADKPYPGAKIDGNSVIVPDLGTIFFGEIFISAQERRLTMVRFDLGSPDGGWVDSIDVGSDGSWYP